MAPCNLHNILRALFVQQQCISLQRFAQFGKAAIVIRVMQLYNGIGLCGLHCAHCPFTRCKINRAFAGDNIDATNLACKLDKRCAPLAFGIFCEGVQANGKPNLVISTGGGG